MSDTPNPGTVDYDTSVIRFDPVVVGEKGDDLHRFADEIGRLADDIGDTIFNLTLSWAGDTSAEAQDFVDRWNRVMRNMFGTEAAAKDNKVTSDDGVLSVLASVVKAAAVAFDQSELQLADLFSSFDMGSGGGTPSPHDPHDPPPPDKPLPPSGGSAPAPETAVIEDFPDGKAPPGFTNGSPPESP